MEELNVKAIRKLSGLSRQDFSARYHIPLRTIISWESTNKSNKRVCPIYVREMLKRLVLLDNLTAHTRDFSRE